MDLDGSRDIPCRAVRKSGGISGELPSALAFFCLNVWRRPELSASFSDATSGVDVASVSVMLDGAKLALGDGELSADGFRTMPGEPLSEGPHALTVILRDRAGNETVRHSQFRVDASGPAKRRGVC